MFIFIDESGDLGSRKGSSRYFLLAAVIADDPKPLEKIIKRIRRGLQKKKRKVKELHAYHTQPSVRKKLLSRLNKIPNLRIILFAYNKKENLRGLSQEDFYFKCAQDVVSAIFHETDKNTTDNIIIIFDKKDSNKFSSKRFITELHQKITHKFSSKFSISLVASNLHKGLQIADFVSWAAFRFYEKEDGEYINIIRGKIVLEESL